NLFLPAFNFCNEVSLMIMLKGRKQSYYFLLANFEATPQTVVGWTGECSLINEVAIRPCLRKNIHILLLQVRGKYQLLFPTENSGGLGTLDMLPAAECDKVSTLRYEFR